MECVEEPIVQGFYLAGPKAKYLLWEANKLLESYWISKKLLD
jgi:hypothetical protein